MYHQTNSKKISGIIIIQYDKIIAKDLGGSIGGSYG
ncbi:MAG: hypothetical protein K0R00_1919 [Herbinix sp.]|jgi:hypothetical protein|nr:hypothetical protein [Herbinix sp.]